MFVSSFHFGFTPCFFSSNAHIANWTKLGYFHKHSIYIHWTYTLEVSDDITPAKMAVCLLNTQILSNILVAFNKISIRMISILCRKLISSGLFTKLISQQKKNLFHFLLTLFNSVPRSPYVSNFSVCFSSTFSSDRSAVSTMRHVLISLFTMIVRGLLGNAKIRQVKD